MNKFKRLKTFEFYEPDNKDVLSNRVITYILQRRPLYEIEELFNQGADVNYKSGALDTPIMVASIRGYKDVINLLLARGADINCQNSNGETPLFFSALNNNMDMCKFLLEKGADVNIRNNYEQTVLFIVIRYNNLQDYVKTLIDAGAELNIYDSTGFAPIHYAAGDRLIAFKELVNAGANLSLKQLHGKWKGDTFIDNAEGQVLYWLNETENQKLILDKEPLLYLSLKKNRHIEISPEIEKEYAYLSSANDLNLV